MSDESPKKQSSFQYPLALALAAGGTFSALIGTECRARNDIKNAMEPFKRQLAEEKAALKASLPPAESGASGSTQPVTMPEVGIEP